MVEASARNNVPSGSAAWPVVALGLGAAAWVGYLLIGQYAWWLRDQWGPAPEVVDALGRDSFVVRHTLPYLTAVAMLDGAAGLCLLVPSRHGWPLAVKVLAAVLLVPTCSFHVLTWFVAGLFAA